MSATWPGAERGVDLRDLLAQLGVVALREAAGDDQSLRPAQLLLAGHLQDRVHRLLLGAVDEGAGVDHDHVGLLRRRARARSRRPAAGPASPRRRRGSWDSPGYSMPTVVAPPPAELGGRGRAHALPDALARPRLPGGSVRLARGGVDLVAPLAELVAVARGVQLVADVGDLVADAARAPRSPRPAATSATGGGRWRRAAARPCPWPAAAPRPAPPGPSG